MRPSVFAVAIALLGAGCVPRALEQPVAERPEPKTAIATPVDAIPLAMPKPTPSLAPRLVVERVEGADPHQMQQAFAQIRQHVKDCAPRSATVLHMRLQSSDEAVRITFEPGLEASPELRRCVLEALSTVDLDDMGSRANPSQRPSGFTALLRVEW
jgi:hypothetical protein